MSRTFAIIEGFAGGPRLSSGVRAAFLANGFSLARRTEADVIVAHSAGCYDIPARAKAGLIMLIDPPYWPGQSILRRARQKIKLDSQTIIQRFGYGYWLKKKFWEIFYILAKPNYMWLVLTSKNTLEFLAGLKDKKIILIRTQNDKFCSPQVAQMLRAYNNVTFLELPGQHDDYYTNPQPYIDLLLKDL